MANEFLDKTGVQTLWNKTKQLVKNYVPYTGAINDLDLGGYTLLTSGVMLGQILEKLVMETIKFHMPLRV